MSQPNSVPVTIPPPEELQDRIRACREELAALKKLLRLSLAARKAEEVARQRQSAARRQGVAHAG
jgi:hypothetical protein